MKNRTEDQQDIALWRYGIISPLLHREANETSMADLLYQLSCRNYVHPEGRAVTFSPETIRKWLYRYNHSGLPGLCDKQRADKGRSAIPEALAEALFALRLNHPRWTLAAMIREMMRTSVWNGRKPSRSALYRFASAHNLTRDPHRKALVEHKRFAFDHFGQLWLADFLHGPKLWNSRNKRKTYLHVILDDCSRVVVHGGFYESESVEPLIQDLMEASKRYGLPQRFYTDNGPAYASRHLKLACARCGIHLVHTPPYRPQGRGKVERFFRTVRDQFLNETRFSGLEEINQQFKVWLAGYHDGIHSSLGCSPLKKRLQVENQCRALSPAMDVESLFRMEKRCRVYADGTIRLRKNVYEVLGCLPGSRVTIYYLPWKPEVVYYGDTMERAHILDPSANARRFDTPTKGTRRQ